MPRDKLRGDAHIPLLLSLDSANHIALAEMITCDNKRMAKQRADELFGRPHPRGGPILPRNVAGPALRLSNIGPSLH